GKHGVVKGRVFLGGNVAGGVTIGDLRHPHLCALQAGGVVGRGAGDDAVVVVGEALGFGEGLTAAGGASVPEGQLGSGAVVAGGDGFGGDGHFVDGAVGEVEELIGVADDESRLVAGVAGVGAGGGVS